MKISSAIYRIAGFQYKPFCNSKVRKSEINLGMWFWVFALIISLNACGLRPPLNSPTNSAKMNDQHDSDSVRDPVMLVGALPPLIIYRTKGDFSNHVPVMMDSISGKIVSFPDPVDLYVEGALAKPVPLDQGYFLDRKGIGPQTVFLSMTYEAYAALSAAPSVQTLMEIVTDRDPFIEMYVCGVRSNHTADISTANRLIAEGLDKACQRIK